MDCYPIGRMVSQWSYIWISYARTDNYGDNERGKHCWCINSWNLAKQILISDCTRKKYTTSTEIRVWFLTWFCSMNFFGFFLWFLCPFWNKKSTKQIRLLPVSTISFFIQCIVLWPVFKYLCIGSWMPSLLKIMSCTQLTTHKEAEYSCQVLTKLSKHYSHIPMECFSTIQMLNPTLFMLLTEF